MSKKRNQVLFTKPEDPKFLKLIKREAGYRDEEPDVDAKRAKFENANNSDNSDYSDNEEEKPQIVVVKSGDLTADEAQREQIRLELENNTKPADLTERIVFKSKDKTKSSVLPQAEEEAAVKTNKSKKSSKAAQHKLSFAFEDDDEEDED